MAGTRSDCANCGASCLDAKLKWIAEEKWCKPCVKLFQVVNPTRIEPLPCCQQCAKEEMVKQKGKFKKLPYCGDENCACHR